MEPGKERSDGSEVEEAHRGPDLRGDVECTAHRRAAPLIGIKAHIFAGGAKSDAFRDRGCDDLDMRFPWYTYLHRPVAARDVGFGGTWPPNTSNVHEKRNVRGPSGYLSSGSLQFFLNFTLPGPFFSACPFLFFLFAPFFLRSRAVALRALSPLSATVWRR